ncbi:hypothetical protein GGR51DRAFT_526407 [Nemania sp. FL0031]|nr:hypothetical protein GGR51DRAFT_526407 [Nemania sp. FL0031]
MRITSSFATMVLGFVVQDLAPVRAADPSKPGRWCSGIIGIDLPNACGDSTFNIEKSSELPLKADCEKLVNGVAWGRDDAIFFARAPTPQTPEYDDSFYILILGNDTCGFAAQVVNGGTAATAMSWGDIADLINDSISHHSTDTHVRTSGTVQCKASQAIVDALDKPNPEKAKPQTISWQLYNRADKSIKVTELFGEWGSG